ncbi:MAG: hypothetical protein KKC57_09680, partial [Alphaproteobacteria bacterium]|nr:hypothetical protein [Alphaproteobacteria bacterium]
VDPQALLHTSQKENRWPTFTPPEAGQSRRYRGLILHRRSQAGPFEEVAKRCGTSGTLRVVIS